MWKRCIQGPEQNWGYTKGMSDFLSSMNTLPVMPEVAAKILSIAETDMDFSFGELENIIRMDPGLTSRVLKVANSAMYARSREITSLQTAIGLMGFKNLRSMVVLVTASSLYRHKGIGWLLKKLWRESVEAAFHTRALALACGYRDLVEEAFLSGLLQDIGKLAFALNFQEDYSVMNRVSQEAAVPDESLCEAEEKQYGIDHKRLGSSILDHWDFPELYLAVCREHGKIDSHPRHKKLIITSTVGASLSRVPSGQGLNQALLDFLKPFLPYLGLNSKDLEEFRNKHLPQIQGGPLYKSCMMLIS